MNIENDRATAGPINVNLTLDKTDPIICEKCKNNVFIPGYMFRKVSKFLTGSPKDSVVPIDVFCCSQCNTPLDDMLPEPLKSPKITS